MFMPASAYGAPLCVAAAAEGGCGCGCPHAELYAGAGATPCTIGCTAVRCGSSHNARAHEGHKLFVSGNMELPGVSLQGETAAAPQWG